MSSATSAAYSLIRANTDELEPILSSKEPVRMSELPEVTQNVLPRARELGVVQAVGKAEDADYAQVYDLDPRAEERLEDLLKNRGDVFPCGHSGLVNLGDGDYTCGFDDCEQIYDRETAEEVFLHE